MLVAGGQTEVKLLFGIWYQPRVVGRLCALSKVGSKNAIVRKRKRGRNLLTFTGTYLTRDTNRAALADYYLVI